MHLSAEPIELPEAPDQWRPLVRINAIGVTFHEQIGMDVYALDPHFDQTEEAAQFDVAPRNSNEELRLTPSN